MSGAKVAVGYLRRSTSKQEQSLADQRREIEGYAREHAYQIVRWYQDDGISGDTTEKREEFLNMRKDAAQREFSYVLCWDQDRFGRFDSLEAGYWIKPFRDAGVELVTLNEGRINWNDYTGRLMYGIVQEGKHRFLRDLSRNTARGQITNAKNGWLCGQAAPYGYDRMIVDEDGTPRQRVRNGEEFSKPRSWHVTLALSDDPVKVATAKWLFEQYADNDLGLRQLADSLNSRGVLSPGGGSWWMGTIREILRNEAYVGDFVWGKRRIGKYHRVAGSEIRERDPSERLSNGSVQVKRNKPEDWIVRRNVWPALISRELFDRVQKKLASRKIRTTAGKKKNGDRYILTGLLHCGHCGAKMYGSKKTRRKAGKMYEYEKYICSTYHTQGKSRCGCHSVEQSQFLDFLLRKIRQAVLAGGHKDELRRRMKKRLEARRTNSADVIQDLRTKLEQLEKDLSQGTKRLLKASDDIADLLSEELSKLRRERDSVAQEIADREQPVAERDLEKQIDEAVDRLWTITSELASASPDRLRELIRRVVSRIDLYFDHVQKGPRVECPLSRGTIELHRDPVLYRLESRGDWI